MQNYYTRLNLFLVVILLFSINGVKGQNNSLILEYNTKVQIDKRLLITDYAYVIQINDSESSWISDIEIPYSENDQIKIIEAAIFDINGKKIRSLRKKEIITRNDISYSSLYTDRFIKEFKLKWDKYPYIIKYKYRIIEKDYLFIATWHPFLYSKIPVQQATLNVFVPKKQAIHIEQSEDLTFNTDTLTNLYHYEWKTENIIWTSSQVFSPPILELIPHVIIVPDVFRYGKRGSFRTWKNYGQWQFETNKDLDELTENEKIIVEKLTKNIHHPKEKIRALYHYLQDNTRYINVAIDIGGMKPYPASYVCENKYGDCKALTNYMKALLKHIGIESYYTKIYAGNNPKKMNHSFPSQQFNHVILCIPLDGDTLWLENTSSYSPMNYLGTFTQNRFALLVKDSESLLVKTPALDMVDVLEESLYQFNLDKEGDGNVSISSNLKGEMFEISSDYQNAGTPKEQALYFEKIIPLKNHEILDWSFEARDRDQPKLKLKLEFSVKNQTRKIGRNIQILPKTIGIPKFENIKLRIHPVRINFPINKKETIVYNLPFIDNFEISLPKNVEAKSVYGLYSENYSIDNGVISLLKIFQLNNGDYALEEYPEFYSFINKVRDIEKNSSILLKRK